MENMSNAEKIQVVINTLNVLEMQPTFSNSSKMVGIYNLLTEVRDTLYTQEQEAAKQAEKPAEVDKDDAEADAE